ncbi:MAG: winged helix-turn-helix transcriptional regulator [Aureispira sp.]
MTFKDFSTSEEQIAPSILSARLKLLTSCHLITQGKQLNNKKENIYLLTKKAIDLTAVLVDITIWGDKHLREFHQIDSIEGLNSDRDSIIDGIKNRYQTMAQNLSLR